MTKETVQGVDEVTKNLAKIGARVGKSTAQAAVKVGHLVRTEAVDLVQGESPGREATRYRSDGTPYQHIAAAPGEPPNTDTGRLVQSIQVEVEEDDVYVGSSLGYSADLEFGTSEMEARPWLNPALESKKKEAKEIFRKDTKKAIGN
jgi:HK97 gp10 family phage protein